ncbi:hypothetical protein [Methylobacterium sp. Leaf112]|uniref:hypothetical protein n=1 Tax=Methylobacterium sp. Leaf112 TaxID=1736258 RepID=UPI000A745A65|nr:hypothetical protein [Methylobacterium sp. Leaf112]
MNGDDPKGDYLVMLDRIAQSLGVPVATFQTAYPDEAPDTETALAGLDQLSEVMALMRLFVRLKKPRGTSPLPRLRRAGSHERRLIRAAIFDIGRERMKLRSTNGAALIRRLRTQ